MNGTFIWAGVKLEYHPQEDKTKPKKEQPSPTTIAAFHPPKKLHVVGHLEMTGERAVLATRLKIDQREMDNLIVFTALVLQVREDEKRTE